jgi:hypothetical protein
MFQCFLISISNVANIFGTSGGAIASLSYGQFKAIRHKLHCQLPSKEPLVMGRKGWIQRSLSGKPVAADKGLQPNTSKPSTQDQNKLRKRILISILAVNGCETWLVTNEIQRKLQIFVNRCLRYIY